MNEGNIDAVKRLRGALIVSSQADAGEPLCAPEHIIALALSAIAGGAKAMRLEGAENIRAARQDRRVARDCPIVGLIKSRAIAVGKRLSTPYITNCFADAEAVADSGADIVAVDGTGRPFLDRLPLQEMIAKIHSQLKKPVWADVATFEQGLAAIACGADLISTTLYGYTQETVLPSQAGPSFELLEQLVRTASVPVVLEGRVWRPEEVTRAFEIGAYAVVVGSAITRPQLITERFVQSIPRTLSGGAAVI